ncbi:MAG: GAF domain-containing protein [Lachnospiraceae bacterium]|nr:GAF domain-containing protein [Lachnospiraceae bacterium]
MNTDYDLLIQQAEALTKDCPHLIANLANISALLYTTLDDINWAGFYFMDDFMMPGESASGNDASKDSAPSKLILGPFQGNPACIEILLGKGVCGTAAQEDKTQLVPDVHQFPGHIACDSASRSEIVIPIHKKGTDVRTAFSNVFDDGAKENNPRSTGRVVGVLDIDSPSLARFTEEDKSGLEKLVSLLEKTFL